MREDLITLSKREIERLRIIHRVMGKQMTQVKASELLGITDRQVRNIIGKIQNNGDGAIAHGNRGRVAANKMPAEFEARIGGIVKRRYPDFGPKFASEKLEEREEIKVSKEKLRQIMIAKGLWRVRRRRKEVHQWRERVKKPVDEPRKRKGKYIPPPDHPWKRHNPSLHHNSYLERI